MGYVYSERIHLVKRNKDMSKLLAWVCYCLRVQIQSYTLRNFKFMHLYPIISFRRKQQWKHKSILNFLAAFQIHFMLINVKLLWKYQKNINVIYIFPFSKCKCYFSLMFNFQVFYKEQKKNLKNIRILLSKHHQAWKNMPPLKFYVWYKYF